MQALAIYIPGFTRYNALSRASALFTNSREMLGTFSMAINKKIGHYIFVSPGKVLIGLIVKPSLAALQPLSPS
jgi:hypothetical protein